MLLKTYDFNFAYIPLKYELYIYIIVKGINNNNYLIIKQILFVDFENVKYLFNDGKIVK